ncbi:NAD(P)H-hydrate dehydratase [Acinetobacter sp. ANC 4633]|uniref:NAD(P)H-hydrate dehydratase n=1 Tax=Acinetobacter sp. ANC 4633 TaxID=2529845 RepID=UPI00103AAE3D|nr:NAD(P)H-hydrate dehydratase [Acinetobacter sp. ANC 4633]TCB28583.1 NAD(P)H-hydrate dehydratase [Acinetobacter sp. ANC 4633]
MQQQVYHSREIQAWEQRWFAQNNSALGLMKQVAWQSHVYLLGYFVQQSKMIKRIAVWCGTGNNAGDGYFIAAYLAEQGYEVDIYAAERGDSPALQQAFLYAQDKVENLYTHFNVADHYDAHIDALFGIGLNRELHQDWQQIIQQFNGCTGLKVSVDIPSGLHANTGQPLPCAIKADLTLTALGYKIGLLTGQGKEFSGQVELLSLIPPDSQLNALAQLSPTTIDLPPRQAFGHKGSYGHALVIGGHADMGGAVIMAAEAAFAVGAGKVSVICHRRHHAAILARAPNVMVRDIEAFTAEQIDETLHAVDAVCLGMGLGRDAWSRQVFQAWFKLLRQHTHLEVVLDADALWFLAEQPMQLSEQMYLTPHSGEAARLLGCSSAEVEQDRVAAIQALAAKFSGQWLLKGSGSLVLEKQQLWVCTAGNAGMGTGGMGDTLAGMIAGLKVQLHEQVALHQVVTLHAQAGDLLAKQGMRGIQASHMPQAVYQVVNAAQ